MPVSKPMPAIGAGCHELRVRDDGKHWRLIYRTDPDAILAGRQIAVQKPRCGVGGRLAVVVEGDAAAQQGELSALMQAYLGQIPSRSRLNAA